jgi:hypothetical protein
VDRPGFLLDVACPIMLSMVPGEGGTLKATGGQDRRESSCTIRVNLFVRPIVLLRLLVRLLVQRR